MCSYLNTVHEKGEMMTDIAWHIYDVFNGHPVRAKMLRPLEAYHYPGVRPLSNVSEIIDAVIASDDNRDEEFYRNCMKLGQYMSGFLQQTPEPYFTRWKKIYRPIQNFVETAIQTDKPEFLDAAIQTDPPEDEQQDEANFQTQHYSIPRIDQQSQPPDAPHKPQLPFQLVPYNPYQAVHLPSTRYVGIHLYFFLFLSPSCATGQNKNWINNLNVFLSCRHFCSTDYISESVGAGGGNIFAGFNNNLKEPKE